MLIFSTPSKSTRLACGNQQNKSVYKRTTESTGVRLAQHAFPGGGSASFVQFVKSSIRQKSSSPPHKTRTRADTNTRKYQHTQTHPGTNTRTHTQTTRTTHGTEINITHRESMDGWDHNPL